MAYNKFTGAPTVTERNRVTQIKPAPRKTNSLNHLKGRIIVALELFKVEPESSVRLLQRFSKSRSKLGLASVLTEASECPLGEGKELVLDYLTL